MRWLLATRMVRSFQQAVLVVIVPLYVAAAGYSALRVGYLLSIASLGAIGMVAAIGFVSDRYGRKPVLWSIALLSALGCAVYALTTAFWPLALMAAISSVGGGGAQPQAGGHGAV